MAVRMTEEFASAMVTVIPIVLLAAALELTAMARAGRANQKRRREAVLAAVRAGAAEPSSTPSKVRRIAAMVVAYGWYWMVILHVVAETMLIRWLAGSRRAAEPSAARFIEAVGVGGFGWVLVSAMVLLTVNKAENTADRRHWDAEVARERAARAAAVPERSVPGPQPAQQP